MAKTFFKCKGEHLYNFGVRMLGNDKLTHPLGCGMLWRRRRNDTQGIRIRYDQPISGI